MGAKRWQRVGRGLVVALAAYFVLGSVVVWTGQWVFRWRAERLLADAERLGRGTGSWGEFQAFQQRWGGWGSYRGRCVPAACEYAVEVYDWTLEVLSPSWVNGLKDPWKYSFPVEYALWPVLRVSHAKMPWISVSVRVTDGQATQEVVSLYIVAEQGWPGNLGFEDGHSGYSLVGGFRMQRGQLYTGRTPIPEWPEAAPVKHVEVDKPSGCENCIALWTAFDDDAGAAELEPLLQVETSCLTRWSYCRDEASIMPGAWARYDSEHAVERAQETRLAACDYPVDYLYRQADNAALMRVTKELDGEGKRKAVLVRSLKGPVTVMPGVAYRIWQDEVGAVSLALGQVGEERVVLFHGEIAMTAPPAADLQAYRCGILAADVSGGERGAKGVRPR